MMIIDMRMHPEIRSQVKSGVSALLVQSRQIWGDTRHNLPDIIVRLMVGVGDIARTARDYVGRHIKGDEWDEDLKKELGNVILSTIRWTDDLGFDVLECLDLAINA